jgi:predicted MFS family arabinose efflux permease
VLTKKVHQMTGLSLLQNRNFFGLLTANTVLGSAMPILIILGGLAGLMLAPNTALATLPASVQTLAGLVCAAPISLLMGRLGRKLGFFLGGALAILGAVLGAYALMAASFVLLCLAHFMLGIALASYQYFRFAAAEVVEAAWQPVAISLMLTSGLVAAFLGPQVFIAAKDAYAGIPLLGAYLAIAALSVAGVVPLVFVRIPKTSPPLEKGTSSRHLAWSALRRPEVRGAILAGALAQGVMVFLMVPTPIAMIGCGFDEAIAGDVIRWHVVAMFAPSFFTGFLIKRFGAIRIVLLGFAMLIASACIAASGIASQHFYLSLILLGTGWNFGFIGATSMLAACVTIPEKPAVQGLNDTLIALSSTVFAFLAGAIIAVYSWPILAGIGLAIVLLGLAGLLVTGRIQRRAGAN